MSKKLDQVRTNIYLSARAWEALKQAAFFGESTANDIVNEEVAKFLVSRPEHIQLSIHRAGDKSQERKPHTIRFHPTLWARLQQIADQERFSVASLIESLLAARFELNEPAGSSQPPVKEPAGQTNGLKRNPWDENPERSVRVGGILYDLGENPYIIDLNGGDVPPSGSGKNPAHGS